MEKIPILVCIDTEPNRRMVHPTRKSDWTGFEKTSEFFRDLRPKLQSATKAPVRFSWFLRMDPQVEHVYGCPDWVVQRYSRIIHQLQADGDEFGLHMHPWRWDQSKKTWVADFADQDWVNHCIQLSYQTFEQKFGRPCTMFSLGDHWMNEASLDLLERLGTQFDVSTQPGLNRSHLVEPHTGSFPDYRRVPRGPYRPAKTKFTEAGVGEYRQIWEIPLSTGSTDWAFSTLDPSNNGAGESNAAEEVRFEGYHDSTDDQWVVGWVWDANHPDRTINVQILEGEELIDTISADAFRYDLLQAGKGNGRHSFRYRIPERLMDETPHSIRVKVADSDFDLYSTPKEMPAASPVSRDNIDMAMYLNHEPFLFSKVMDRLLVESDRPHLALIGRSDVGVKENERCFIERNFEHILTHPLADRFVFETAAGFVERVSGQAIGQTAGK
jgi:hypothetical protein